MSKLSVAYLFHNQHLLVDENFQLPRVEALNSDLAFNPLSNQNEQVIARDLKVEDYVPDGLQLVPIRQLISIWSIKEFEQASRAIQLLEWRRNHKFCSHCGERTQVHPVEYAMICPRCRYRQYPRVQPCVITIITKDNQQVLLAKNAHNQSNMYGLIAGFVEVGETLEQAVARETLEEVGIKVKNIKYMSSQPWPFPSNLMVAFHAEYDSGELILQESEISDADFFDYDDLPNIPFKGSIARSMIDEITQKHQ